MSVENTFVTRPDTTYPDENSIRPDQDAQLHVFDSENREIVLSAMSIEERQRFYTKCFEDAKCTMEAVLGMSVRLVPDTSRVEIFIEGNENGLRPDAGLEYGFVFPEEIDIMYVYNNHSPDNASPIEKRKLIGITRVLLAYILMMHPKIEKMNALLSDTNAARLKRPATHPGKYGNLANVPLYKSQAALGFGKVIEIVGGSVSTTHF